MDKIPLNYEASQGDTNKQETPSLPPELIQCLENARFLHLATCADNVPQVSLMNYTYLPSSPHSRFPVIVMTSNTASRKTSNIAANSNVSLLVHDWVSHRPPTNRRPSASPSSGGTIPPDHRSSLASLLFNLNSSAVSSISATIAGTARISPPSSPEEEFYLAQHLQNNTFEDPAASGGSGDLGADGRRRNDSDASVRPDSDAHLPDTGRTEAQADQRGSHFVAGEDVRVIVVEIKSVRISDFKGTVRDWVLVSKEGVLSNGTSES